MEFLGIVLVVSGAVSASMLNVGRRWVLRQKLLGVSSFLFFMVGIGCLTVFLASSFWVGLASPFQANSSLFWMAVLASGLVNVAVQYAGVKSSSLAEASLIAPVQALTPGLVTIAAWGLGEQPTTQGLLGIFLIASGTYIHGREGATTLREYLKPLNFLFLPANYDFLSEKGKEEARSECRGLRWAYLSAVLGTIGLIFDGLISRNGNVVSGIAFKWLVVALFLVIGFSLWQRRPETNPGKELKLSSLISKKFILFVVVGCGIAFGLADLFPAVVFRLAPIAYVGTLKRLAIPLTVLLSWFLLQEKKAARRIWPAIVISLGAILLAFDPGIESIVNEAQRRIKGGI